MVAIELISLPCAVMPFLRQTKKQEELTADMLPILLMITGVIAVFCALMLPTVARRFQDHGWSGHWFRRIFLLGLPCIVFGSAALVLGVLSNNDAIAWLGFGLSFFAGFVAYASVIWTFWIGFVRPEPGANAYGPLPGTST